LNVRKVEGGYEVRQRRFHRGFIDENYRDQSTRWTIPLTIRRKIPLTEEWREVESRVMWSQYDVIFIESASPILINSDGQYYYRVIYDDYKPFYAHPNTTMNTERRLQQTKVLDDAMGGMLSGYIDPSLVFRFAAHSGIDMPNSFF
ncbi:hypothetical protein PMAYCL1PPCAC_29796, partial [Pristionchus mayeri]